jgi:gamma-glutamyltranspeptidase
MDLYTAGHRRGVVAAPHHAAVEAGRAVLAEGGNALEAMVAMAATIAVVYPHMAQMGGDGFWLMRQPSGRPRALMAAGRSGGPCRRDCASPGRNVRSRSRSACRRRRGGRVDFPLLCREREIFAPPFRRSP